MIEDRVIETKGGGLQRDDGLEVRILTIAAQHDFLEGRMVMGAVNDRKSDNGAPGLFWAHENQSTGADDWRR